MGGGETGWEKGEILISSQVTEYHFTVGTILAGMLGRYGVVKGYWILFQRYYRDENYEIK